MVAKDRERLPVSEQETRTVDVEIFNFMKLNDVEVRKQSHIKISNRLAALENLSYGEDVSRGWENIKETIKISAKENLSLYELKQHKP